MSTAIIGAGGIGSWFCRFLRKALDARQIPGNTTNHFTVFDDDIVEPKNCKHQDYSDFEVGVPKAAIIGMRYSFKVAIRRFTVADIPDFDRYIICADNAAVRRTVYTQAKALARPFIDMRAEGDTYALYTHKEELDVLLKSLGEDPESEVGYSCQRPIDVSNNLVQDGYLMVAVMGMDTLKRQLREVLFPRQVIRSIL